MFRVKRAYERPSPHDGLRVLVDRRWPCRVYKKDAAIDWWPKEIAPSEELTLWFHRDPAKWDAYRRRYWGELQDKEVLIEELEDKARTGTVTLVYRAKDIEHNNALALLQYLEHRAAMREQRKAA